MQTRKTVCTNGSPLPPTPMCVCVCGGGVTTGCGVCACVYGEEGIAGGGACAWVEGDPSVHTLSRVCILIPTPYSIPRIAQNKNKRKEVYSDNGYNRSFTLNRFFRIKMLFFICKYNKSHSDRAFVSEMAPKIHRLKFDITNT